VGAVVAVAGVSCHFNCGGVDDAGGDEDNKSDGTATSLNSAHSQPIISMDERSRSFVANGGESNDRMLCCQLLLHCDEIVLAIFSKGWPMDHYTGECM
jgi:hypothetical protein